MHDLPASVYGVELEASQSISTYKEAAKAQEDSKYVNGSNKKQKTISPTSFPSK